jgi:hypothetical protein
MTVDATYPGIAFVLLVDAVLDQRGHLNRELRF